MKLAVFLFLLLVIPSVTFAGGHEKKYKTDNECKKEVTHTPPVVPNIITPDYMVPVAPKQPPVASNPPPVLPLSKLPNTAYSPTFFEWLFSFFKVQ